MEEEDQHHQEQQHNAGAAMEEEDDYDMDDAVDDTDGEDYLGPEARDSDSDSDDEEYARGDYKASDTTAQEARHGKDIQGIPWVRLSTTREKYRAKRLVDYKNYENIPNSAEAAMKACKPTEKGGKYYEFCRNTRKVKSTTLSAEKFSMGYIKA